MGWVVGKVVGMMERLVVVGRRVVVRWLRLGEATEAWMSHLHFEEEGVG